MDELEGTANTAGNVLLDFIELGTPIIPMQLDNPHRLGRSGQAFAGEMPHPLLHA